NCPLDPGTTERCPVAVNLVKLVTDMGGCLSSDEVDVEVTTPERTVIKHTTMQRAVSSLIGVVVATSGCPRTVFFKPMARFHLPLASEEETIYRAASMYLLAQYFLHQQGQPADWHLERLSALYKNLQVVNSAMAQRLRAASDKDAAVNAIVLLDLFAKALPYTIEESLEEIRYLYRAYLNGEINAGLAGDGLAAPSPQRGEG
ncbi:MAG TPA: hypothetical protein VKA13_02670, partial [Gammaproteobacteria bacterium]|nr:hypothetical protein [Gammaproteobacteria bacterium]